MRIRHFNTLSGLIGTMRNEARMGGESTKRGLADGDLFALLVQACGNNRKLAEALVAYERMEHDRPSRRHAITAALSRIQTYQRYNRLLEVVSEA